MPAAAHPSAAGDTAAAAGFEVRLENFRGPFDVLLGLITKHELDITEIALATVTDEFIGYIRALTASGQGWALDEASEFLVIAATLLDLKAARLLPAGDVEDDDDIALLEARDLLFARLLQYRAFKEVASLMERRLEEEGLRFPRDTALEPHLAAMLPELVWKTSAGEFGQLARKALEPKPGPPTEVGLAHLHAPRVSVREQARIIGDRLRQGNPLTFLELAEGATPLEIVGRFLALLEMFRDGVLAFDQPEPLGELKITWTGTGSLGWSASTLTDEYDDADEETDAAAALEPGH
ncbi:MAG: chromosome segregation protein ScpA [Arthrobacter koreensis]|uniref:segregation and condensation protein A n=1 Tax=Arthrobacter koreensis TaxID=199136 RepID=UPI002409A3C1|nr:segregation/condensation protein A [Arthrobacter koreensis]MDF2497710.1 chromosome segregation protein ScpA [Arthrobacter koreensis]